MKSLQRSLVIATVFMLASVGVSWADDKKGPSCQAQLAERTWSYEQLAKDRQVKEQQRDHAEVQVYFLQRTVEQLQGQLADLKKTLEKTEPPQASEPEKEK